MTRSLYRLLVAVVACALLLTAVSFVHASKKPRKRAAVREPVPIALRGSEDAMAREARIAHRFGMPRFSDADALRSAIASGYLVRIRESGPVVFDEKLGEMDAENRELYAHAQPQVHAFLVDLVTDRLRPEGTVIKVTSMVRTLEYQRALRRRYTNAAKDDASSHPTGATVDISSKDMAPEARAWLREKLSRLEANGMVQATEETGRYGTAKKPGSSCFHVMVSPAYLKYRR